MHSKSSRTGFVKIQSGVLQFLIVVDIGETVLRLHASQLLINETLMHEYYAFVLEEVSMQYL